MDERGNKGVKVKNPEEEPAIPLQDSTLGFVKTVPDQHLNLNNYRILI